MQNINLDDIKIYRQYDPEGMLTHIEKVPQLCRQAWQQAIEFPLPPDYHDINKLIILGMGGSAIGGDLAISLANLEVSIPMIVKRDYDLPLYVDKNTLVIASSYSGNTEEVLSAFTDALRTNAKKLVLTNGGKIKDLAIQAGIPVFEMIYQAKPRAALPFSLLPLLHFFQQLGFVCDKSADVEETISILEKMSSELNASVATADNTAKQMAEQLYGKLPVIYSAGFLAAVALRWKTQFNENSKAWAYHEIIPELNHNALVGYQYPKDLVQKMMVVLLHSDDFSNRIQLRYQITAKLLGDAEVAYQTVNSKGASALSQMMSTLIFGDFVSYYLALLYRVNPSPIAGIDYLKQLLAHSD